MGLGGNPLKAGCCIRLGGTIVGGGGGAEAGMDSGLGESVATAIAGDCDDIVGVEGGDDVRGGVRSPFPRIAAPPLDVASSCISLICSCRISSL